ncbi:hypothetical protein WDZ17_12435 [Pseudokineococcus basanitobsidens]|uniref:DUF4190 domain-containing protein n=1 Tax=Pseudokineococcus basanitobsidens TaxID=1926649 RepID=A0ABU8RM13_9ACTN
MGQREDEPEEPGRGGPAAPGGLGGLVGRADDEVRNDVATTAVVLGVLSVVLSVLTGVPALVAGLVGLVRARRLRTGAVRSGVAVALGVASVVVAVVVVRAVAPAWQTLQAVADGPADDLLVSGSPVVRAGAEEAVEVLEAVGLDPASLQCTPPAVGLDVTVTCTGDAPVPDGRSPGTDGPDGPVGRVDVAGSCPATVLRGEAVCDLRVGDERHRVRVVLRDGVPEAELLDG